MYEQTDPAHVPGLPPLERHTCYDDNGDPLPDVRYSYARKTPGPGRRKKILLTLLLLALIALLIAAAAF
jgi:hypothetical protein